jgi:hypothetical protein
LDSGNKVGQRVNGDDAGTNKIFASVYKHRILFDLPLPDQMSRTFCSEFQLAGMGMRGASKFPRWSFLVRTREPTRKAAGG